MSETPPPVGELLRRTDPDRLVEVIEDHVKKYYGAYRADALLADYQIAGLWPLLHGTHSVAGSLRDRSAAARSFSSQRVVIERLPTGSGVRVLLPLSVWGERIGVLLIDSVSGLDDDQLGELSGLADELAVALLNADRITDRYRRARRTRRLTMAAEMQWEMLPGRALSGPNFTLAGQLEPAYAVCGDHFDWSLTDHRLTITALNGYGQGMDATLLTLLAVNAMRNARRSGGNLVEQAELASEALFSRHAGRAHTATLLLEVNLDTGLVLAIDGGSPRALRLRSGQTTPIGLEQQLPLGMFDDTRYEIQRFTLEPADRLFIISDGVHAATPGDQAPFGDRHLHRVIRSTRLQPPTEAVGSVMRGLHDYHEGDELVDDAVVLCLDWHGQSGDGRQVP
ncbi:PP2C family protein-serine/threonine phosphatase [Rugosimonospora africana]|uniref:Phosphatase n=1 Tax=Rugosimonospora africana TaxID=556532 RepID=A0A8J3R261_9ACTN|nr:PP2C family protein-serine/threonine phosphatase [Rugosimonospora africana]GIH20399.1 phosphatase [Rugosimonospora africana]